MGRTHAMNYEVFYKHVYIIKVFLMGPSFLGKWSSASCLVILWIIEREGEARDGEGESIDYYIKHFTKHSYSCSIVAELSIELSSI